MKFEIDADFYTDGSYYVSIDCNHEIKHYFNTGAGLAPNYFTVEMIGVADVSGRNSNHCCDGSSTYPWS